MKIKLGDPILRPLSDEQIASLSRQDLIVLARGEQKIRAEYEKFMAEVQARIDAKERLTEELKERLMEIEGRLCRIRSRVFGKSSERSPRHKDDHKDESESCGPKKKVTRKPSERYPNADIIEKEITLEEAPACKCCGQAMVDSGMTETSEHLTVVPKNYVIVREIRHKYRCTGCHGDIVTAPRLPRVIPGSSYSDDMVVDATLSKYCDLIPMERYCQMAKRQGFDGLPPQSLIAGSFKLGEFLLVIYELIKRETLQTPILLADETPHRMLEGDERSHWYLWGFSSERLCFYECHDTRSGDIAAAVLKQSTCAVLLTDVYSGYRKAVKEVNKFRVEENLPPIQMAFCNSHARRQFKSFEHVPEAAYMIEQYKKIYHLERMTKEPGHDSSELRAQMRPYFEAMRAHCEQHQVGFSNKSDLGRAMRYFLNNYDGLTLGLSNPFIPMDNNAAERQLRSPVVGRKTWYGTHSKDGAKAAAIHFTIIESCKLNSVNPRIYYREMIRRLHTKESVVTPFEFKRDSKPV